MTQRRDACRSRIEAPDLCGRFSGRVVSNVDPTAPTPAWMVDRLARCGQRSVSALVDISNYVMFEYGRPSHIFDLDKIHGGLAVRWARAGETLELLNGSTVELDPTVGVIADDQRRRIAGRHHGRRSDGGLRRHAQHLRRSRVLVAGRGGRAFAALQLHDRCRASFRARRRSGHHRRAHRAHHRSSSSTICGGRSTRCGPIDDQVVELAERRTR